MDKSKVIQAWREELQGRKKAALARQKDAREGMRVDGDHRPANRGERATVTSQGYLTEGVAKRLEDIQEALDLLDRVGEGPRDKVVMGACVVALKQDGESFRFVLLPGGDASEVASQWGAIWVLSPQAPLVRPFLGAEEGDEVDVLSTSRQGLWEVAEVR